MLLCEMLEEIDGERKFSTPIGVMTVPNDTAFYGMLLGKYKGLILEYKEQHKARCKKEPRVRSDIQNAEKSILQFYKDLYYEVKQDLASVKIYDVDDKTIEGAARDSGFTWKGEAVIATVYDYIDSTNEKISFQYRELMSESVNAFRTEYKMTVEQYLAKVGVLTALQDVLDGAEIYLIMIIFAFIQYKMDVDITIDFDNIEQLKESSLTLLENVENGIVSEDDVDSVLSQIIQKYPYLPNAYYRIIDRYGDESEEVECLANYVGVEIHDYKDKLAKKFLKEHSMDTEEEAIDAKDELLDYCTYLGMDTTQSEAVALVDKKLEEFDLQYRTVEGVVCETREGADFARQELPDIKTFMEGIKAPATDALLDYEMNLLEKKAEFESKFQSEIKVKYIAIMDKYLKDFDTFFCMVGMFKTLDRKSAGKERLLKIIKKSDVSTIENIDKAYQQMLELLPKVGLEEEEADTTLKYLENSRDVFAMSYIKAHEGITEEDAVNAKEKLIAYYSEIGLVANDELRSMQYIDKKLKDFDLKYRTVDGIECKTREGADLSRDELPQMRNIVNQLAAPNQNSLLDYEQDLLEKKKNFEETFQSELKEKYLKTFDKYLKDFDKLFCSMGLLKRGSRKEAGIFRAIKYVKGLKLSNMTDLEKAYEDVRELLPKLGLTENDAVEAMTILNNRKEVLENKKGLFGGLFKK